MNLPNFSRKKCLFLVCTELLYVNGVLHLQALQDRRLVELLTTTQLFYNAGLIEFAFEFLDSALDIFAFLNRYDDHCMTPPFAICFILLLLVLSTKRGRYILYVAEKSVQKY